jgi:hypothetical protein
MNHFCNNGKGVNGKIESGGTNTMKSNVGSWAGKLGPLIFTLVFTIDGFFHANYSPVKNYIGLV